MTQAENTPQHEEKPAAPAPPKTPPPPRAGDAFGRATAFFSMLDKCIRASKLYEGRGALVRRLLANLVVTAQHAVGEGELTVSVTPFGLLLADEAAAPWCARSFRSLHAMRISVALHTDVASEILEAVYLDVAADTAASCGVSASA